MEAQFAPLIPGAPRRWLVTGAAGFIGSHLVEQLLRAGQHVTGVDNFATGRRENLERLRVLTGPAWRNFTFLEGDICDPQLCAAACRGNEVVLHQAALGSVPRSIADPFSSHHSNVTGFIGMLLAAKESGVNRFVYASSSSVYGDSPQLPKQEQVIGELLSPYAATKRIDELYAGVFARQYGMQIVGLRYFNVFGPRQDPNGAYAAVIPRWIGELQAGQRPTIYGDGTTSRDFCFVSNVVQANIRAAMQKHLIEPHRVFNIACNERTTLRALYGIIKSELESAGIGPLPEPHYAAERAGDIQHSLADISRAAGELGYSPAVDVAAGLKITVRSFLEK